LKRGERDELLYLQLKNVGKGTVISHVSYREGGKEEKGRVYYDSLGKEKDLKKKGKKDFLSCEEIAGKKGLSSLSFPRGPILVRQELQEEEGRTTIFLISKSPHLERKEEKNFL